MVIDKEYTVYESAGTSYDPIKGLHVEHPVAHYDDYGAMIDHWLEEFLAGTHNFFVTIKE